MLRQLLLVMSGEARISELSEIYLKRSLCGLSPLLGPAITVRLKPVPTCRAAAVPGEVVVVVREVLPGAIIGCGLLYLPGAPQPSTTSTGRQAGPLTPATITEPPGWTGKYFRSVLLFAPSQQLQDYILRHDHETRILCRRNRGGWKYFKNIFVTPSSPPSTSDNEPA